VVPVKKLLITQSNYIPWKGYFDSINMVDEFIIYDDVQYTKRDWRNRNLIKTGEGLKWLSVPIEVKGKFLQKINESKISDKDWAGNHWSEIKQWYAKTPRYNEMKGMLEGLYMNMTEEYLTQVNRKFITAICSVLGIKTLVLSATDFTLVEGKTERLVDLCIQRRATDYYTGPAAKNYLDESLFKKENIRVHYIDYSGYSEYPQQFPPFEHGVTVLDLIFNTGWDAPKYMKSFSAANIES
jgi:hypothetical protein